MKKCKFCQGEIEEEVVFCSRCGADMRITLGQTDMTGKCKFCLGEIGSAVFCKHCGKDTRKTLEQVDAIDNAGIKILGTIVMMIMSYLLCSYGGLF